MSLEQREGRRRPQLNANLRGFVEEVPHGRRRDESSGRPSVARLVLGVQASRGILRAFSFDVMDAKGPQRARWNNDVAAKALGEILPA
jgi:hypothetical protein